MIFREVQQREIIIVQSMSGPSATAKPKIVENCEISSVTC